MVQAMRMLRLILPVIGMAALLGCRSVEDREGHAHECQDIPNGAVPRRAGAHACEWLTAQERRAEQDKYVIYENEWRGNSTDLGPYGERHVTKIAKNISETPYPVLIQPSSAPSVDEKRREKIVNELLEAGFAEADTRVVIARPEAEGLYSIEAPGIARRYSSAGAAGQGGQGAGFGGSSTGQSASGGLGGGGFGGGGFF